MAAIKVETKALLDAKKRLAMRSSATSPLLIKISSGASDVVEKVVLTCAGTSGWARAIIDADVDGRADAVVPYDVFSKCVQNIQEKETEIIIEDDHIVLVSSNARMRINTVAAIFSDPPVDYSYILSMPHDCFVKMARGVMFATSSITEPLTSVLVNIRAGFVDFVGTDSFRLAIATRPTSAPDAFIKLPRKLVAKVVAINAHDSNNIVINTSGHFAHIEVDGVEAWELIPDNAYPNYELVTKFNIQDYDVVVENIAWASMIRALKAVKSVRENNKDVAVAVITVDSDGFSIGSLDGATTARIPAIVTMLKERSVAATTKINADFLLGADVFFNGAKIYIASNDARAIVFKKRSDDIEFTYIVAPMRK